MNIKIILTIILIISSSTFSMEHSNTRKNYKKRQASEIEKTNNNDKQKNSNIHSKKRRLDNLSGMFIEQPGSLAIQAAWHALQAGKTLPPHLSELEDKIKNIQHENCPKAEKQLFLNLINNPLACDDLIKQHFKNIIENYMTAMSYLIISKIELLNSILILASQVNNLQVAQLAIDTGANVNAEAGLSALHWALLNRNKDIIELLIKSGADVNRKSPRGYTPLAYIADIEYNSSTSPDKKQQLIEIANMLISNGANVNAHDNNGNTPLILAVKNRNILVAQILLDNGAEVNAQNNQGNTALIAASMAEGKVDMIELLAKHKADINIRNYNGQTALILAAIAAWEKSIRTLLKLGADVNIQDNTGKTALEYAQEKWGWSWAYKHIDILEMLKHAISHYNKSKY